MSNNGVDCNGILGVYCFSPTCGVAGLHECRQWPDGRRARTHIHDACSCGDADWCCPTGEVAGFHGIADDQMGRGGEGIEMYGNTGFAA
ncbi:hypothetical protein ACQJBY_015330 [Aegilops geniculata]